MATKKEILAHKKVCPLCKNMQRIPFRVKFVGIEGRVVCVVCERMVPKGNSPEGYQLFRKAWSTQSAW